MTAHLMVYIPRSVYDKINWNLTWMRSNGLWHWEEMPDSLPVKVTDVEILEKQNIYYLVRLTVEEARA